jgi:hypothetical protein
MVSTFQRPLWTLARTLGISLLIVSVIRVPLPQADYHNIRHHHAPGEVCVYHDHLLRWHPSAGSDEDIALLHWHWVVPSNTTGSGDLPSDEKGPGPGNGLALHAHLGDLVEPEWSGDAMISADRAGRFGGAHIFALVVQDLAIFGPVPRDRDEANHWFGTQNRTLSACALAGLLERWNC